MQDGWGEVVDRHAAMVVAAALRVTGNTADAEDVAQDVFCEAFATWQREPESCSGGLLRTMAVRRAIDLVRRRRSRRLSEAEPHRTRPEAGVDGSMMEDELDRQLRDQLGKLAPREAEAFTLRYYERLSVGEIARHLGTSQTAVSKALSVARCKLQQGLQAYLTGGLK
jgi:RNA polymerase sigma-70 factor (ECF subfamily)